MIFRQSRRGTEENADDPHSHYQIATSSIEPETAVEYKQEYLQLSKPDRYHVREKI
jgi:hypothetical protein